MLESDWKKFRAMVPALRERYLAERNAHIATKLAQSNKTETDRFWAAMEMMEREAKTLRRCLDHQQRSQMLAHILQMKEDLADSARNRRN